MCGRGGVDGENFRILMETLHLEEVVDQLKKQNNVFSTGK